MDVDLIEVIKQLIDVYQEGFKVESVMKQPIVGIADDTTMYNIYW